MLGLDAWLRSVGLDGRNPFANKQADEERDWLQECFVEHPAYDAMARELVLHSSILHAVRGAGKTSTCTMYEQTCADEAEHRRSLVVRLNDWVGLSGLRGTAPHLQLDGYVEVLLPLIVAALWRAREAAWLQPPADPSLRRELAWFCRRYDAELTEGELDALLNTPRLFDAPPAGDDLPPRVSRLPPRDQIRRLLRALAAAGVKAVIVLVDRVDEVVDSAAEAVVGAELLLPIVGNLLLMERDGLVFKLFIPSEIVAELRAKGKLRHDRIRCYDLSWSGPDGVLLLKRVLQNRLLHFSNLRIDSLAALAATDLRDVVDDRLSEAAEGSPRRLLILGEELFRLRAADATPTDLLIERRHLEAALAMPIEIPALRRSDAPAVGAWAREPAPVAPAAPPPPEEGAGEPELEPVVDEALAPRPAPAAADSPPPLRMAPDCTLYRGGEPLPRSQSLPIRQRLVVRYLLSKANTVCHFSELGKEIWNDGAVSEDTVRKVLGRLMAYLSRYQEEPPYLQRLAGGFYLLAPAEPLPLEEAPLWTTLKAADGRRP